MIVNITNRSSKVSADLRNRIEGWLNHSQERYEVITRAQVTLAKSERQDEAEVTLHVAGKEVFAKANGDNMYAALDTLGQKVDRQLAKIHQKRIDHK